MATRIIMPQLGESVPEGTVSKWLIAEGDSVKEFDPLLEITTDKVDTEITAAASGTLLKIAVGEGVTVQAGALLGWIGEPDEALPAEKSVPVMPEKTQPAASSARVAAASPPIQSKELGFISPVVAKLAAEHSIDLQQVTGTGANGRITKKDVLQYIAATAEQEAPSPVAGQTIELSNIRKTIAEHMVRSKHTAPHVTTVFEVDLSKVSAHRAAHQAQFAREGARLTFTSYFIIASVAGLKAQPLVNSTFAEERILVRDEINIGIAVSLGAEGLIVPVIKHADELSLLALVRHTNDLAARARQKHLKPDEVQDGTFTITNHGRFGSLLATPIINQPQCAILGVGAIQKRVVVIDDAIAIRPMAYVTLTFDHRIIDGAVADQFLAQLKETLEAWPT